MNFIKKQSIGFYFTVLTILALICSLVGYILNCKTKYYVSFGVDTALVVFLVLSIAAEVVYIIGCNKMAGNWITDIIPVAAGVFSMLAMVAFLEVRAYSIATILTFQNNDSNLADMKGAIIAMVFCGAAVVFSILSSFMKVVKEE